MKAFTMTHPGKISGFDLQQTREDIKEIFLSAIDGVDASQLIRDRIQLEGDVLRIGKEEILLDRYTRIHVMGIGKAAAHMAAPLEDILGERITDGLVIVKYGYGVPLQSIRLREAGHPLPDINGVRATEEVVGMIRACGEEDLILFLISGGGSSLFVLPVEGLTLEDKIQTNDLLLDSGATIDEINTVRKFLSAVKDGKLISMVQPATLVGLVLSDVIGDRLSTIASGPTVPQQGTNLNPLEIIERYSLTGRLPGNVRSYLENRLETSRFPDDPPSQGFSRGVKNLLIGNNEILLEHAVKKAEQLGYATCVVTSCLQGEAREEAAHLSSKAIKIKKGEFSIRPPACIIAGGETTVTVKHKGTGGRCQEFALAAAISLEGEQIVTLAAGTDGTDGPTDAAGAIVDGDTCRKGKAAGLEPHSCLERNDSYTYFRSTGELLMTGPTKTNVMDLYAFIIP
jgi:hydroxypyruvate reductase